MLVQRAALGLPGDASLSTTNAIGPHYAERRGLVLYPRLIPLGTTRLVDDVLLPLGRDGYRYSADSPREYAQEIETTLHAGYVPVAIAGNVVRLERADLAGKPIAALSWQLDSMLGRLTSGRPVPRSGWPGTRVAAGCVACRPF